MLVSALGACVASASFYVYSQQKQQLVRGLERKAETEVDLIGASLTDAMLRHDYSEGLQLLTGWPNNHHGIDFLQVVFDNGRVFFSYGDENASNDLLKIERTFQYATRSLTMTVAHDLAETKDALTNLGWNLAIYSLLLTALMGTTLWFVLFRWMIAPMEQEIETQTHELRAAKTNLEDQVKDRTALLLSEVEIRKKAEQSLRKLVRAVEQSPVMIFITNLDGMIEYVNPKFVHITGYSPEEAIGRTPNILKSPDTPASVHEDLWSNIKAGREWHHEMKDRRKDGTEFWANVSISPIRGSDDVITHFVAMHEDITERKMAEEAMRNAQQAAELANKAKTDLMANMSHELRTPLNAIIGFSETMKHSVFGPMGNPQYEEYAAFIHSSGTHLLHLINDILDVSAVEAGKLTLREEEVSLADICEAALHIIRPKAREAYITLTGIEDTTLPLLMADPLRLKQIFINLLSNAIKFTPERGTVTCSASLDEENNMLITFADTGIGMDGPSLNKALEKFGQVDSSLSRKHEGTGLGLPLTKGLVELHGGVMEIFSEPDKGTTVTIRFPAERVIMVDQDSLAIV
ncbi:PAS domain-containing sensor histidine kinase [Magnetovibrio sp.]|uniref:sensor histidine kinase n=1 Tax=Magnetovibrio sp. TaxID=2024836 RepID=UPI002F91CF7C